MKKNILTYHTLLLILFTIAGMFYYVEDYNTTIIFEILICLIIYNMCKTRFHLQLTWLSHPLRLIIPTILIIQSFWWIAYIFSSRSITFFNYDWKFDYHSDPKYIPHVYSSFLLLISTYFYAIAIFYKPKKSDITEEFKISSNNILYIILFIIIIISLLDYIFIYASFSMVNIPPIFIYILKLFAKLRPLFSLMIIYFLWHKNTSKSKFFLILFIFLYLLIGFIGLNLTTMRQLLFEPIIITIIFFYTIRHKLNLSPKLFFLISIFTVMTFYLFNTASKIKFEEISSPMEENKSIGYNLMSSFEHFVFRSTLYSADVIALSNPESKRLLKSSGDDLLLEIASGIPFGGLLVPHGSKPYYSIDMQFYWSYSPIGISSAYVSGTSSLWFLFGTPLAVLLVFIIGVFHAKIFTKIADWLGTKHNWLVIYSMTSLFLFNGLQRSDIIGLPVNCLICAVILKQYFIKKSSSINLSL